MPRRTATQRRDRWHQRETEMDQRENQGAGEEPGRDPGQKGRGEAGPVEGWRGGGQRGSCPPLITVGELHVQAVAAEEGPPAQWGLQAARVGDGFTDEHQALQGGLQVGAPCWGSLCKGLVGPHVSRAVQHLVGVRGTRQRCTWAWGPTGLGGMSLGSPRGAEEEKPLPLLPTRPRPPSRWLP